AAATDRAAPAAPFRPATGSRAAAPAAPSASRSPWSSASKAASPATPRAPRSTTSCAAADCPREEDSSQSTRGLPGAGSAAPTPQESRESFFPPLHLGPRDLIGERTQLLLVEHGAVHHADQDLFDRSVAEPVDDALDGLGRHPSALFGGLIDIGAAIHRVRRVTLLFQPAQHRPHRRFLESL